MSWLLFSHEDNPNEKIWFKTPALAAKAKGIPIFTPEKISTPEWLQAIADLRPDLIISVYYRNMINSKILALAPLWVRSICTARSFPSTAGVLRSIGLFFTANLELG